MHHPYQIVLLLSPSHLPKAYGGKSWFIVQHKTDSASSVMLRILSPLVISLFPFLRDISLSFHFEGTPCRFHAQQDGQRIDAAFMVCTHLRLSVLPHFKQRCFSLFCSVHDFAAGTGALLPMKSREMSLFAGDVPKMPSVKVSLALMFFIFRSPLFL